MSTPQPDAVNAPYRLWTARVVRVREQTCEVWSNREVISIRFAAMFPSPRVERVSPGNLVAAAAGPNGDDVVVWRWYDAVVLGAEDDESPTAPAPAPPVSRWRSSSSNQHRPGGRPSTHPPRRAGPRRRGIQERQGRRTTRRIRGWSTILFACAPGVRRRPGAVSRAVTR
jgi:hypothetical protein